jgi:hypothetical protein
MIVLKRHSVVNRSRRVRTARAAGLGAGAERLIHDPLNGANAAPTLRATPQAAIDLPRRARRALSSNSVTDIVVGKDVAGTNDHEKRHARRLDCHVDIHCAGPMQKEKARFEAIPNY